jgi:hypothetical protein
VSVEHTKPPPAAAAAAAAAGDDGLRVELSSGDGPGQLRTIQDIQEGELTTGNVSARVLLLRFLRVCRDRVMLWWCAGLFGVA